MSRRVQLLLTPSSADSQVLLDGEPVTNCRAVTVHAEVGKPTTVTFEIHNVEVLVDAGVNDEEARIVDVTTLLDDQHVRRVVKV